MGKRKYTDSALIALHNSGLSGDQIAQRLNISLDTVRLARKRLELKRISKLRQPRKPHQEHRGLTGKLTVRYPIELEKQIRKEAERKSITVSQFLVEAIKKLMENQCHALAH